MAKIQKKSKQQFHLIPFFYFPPKDCPSGSHQTIFPQKPQNPQKFLAQGILPQIADMHRLGGYGIPAIPTQPPNYLPTEFAEHTETTGGEEKSVYICEIRGRLFSARSFCVFCEICGRISSARNFCVFCEFCGKTCANKLGMGSMEGIWRAAWVWQPQNYLSTEFTKHTETTGGEEKSVYICAICGRLFSARSFCVFCEICGRISSA